MLKKLKTTLIVKLVLLLFFLSVNSAFADVPQRMNIQGRLTDADGVNVSDGQYNLTFSIWDSGVDGIKLWGDEPQSVNVKDGVFQAFIGDVNAEPLTPHFDGTERYLQIHVEGEPQPLMPRQRLTTVSYAFRADNLDGKDSSDFLNTSSNFQRKEGRLFIYQTIEEDAPTLRLRSIKGHGIYLHKTGTGSGMYIKHDGVEGTNAIVVRSIQNGITCTATGKGLSATTETDYSFAGEFVSKDRDRDNPGLKVYGYLQVTGPSAFVEDHPTDPTKEIMYVSLEGSKPGTQYHGTAQLTNGAATITLPDHFSWVTSETEPLTVTVTPLENCNGLYVDQKNTTQVVVKELNNGTSNAGFDYIIIGIRKGYENFQVIRDKMEM